MIYAEIKDVYACKFSLISNDQFMKPGRIIFSTQENVHSEVPCPTEPFRRA